MSGQEHWKGDRRSKNISLIDKVPLTITPFTKPLLTHLLYRNLKKAHMKEGFKYSIVGFEFRKKKLNAGR